MLDSVGKGRNALLVILTIGLAGLALALTGGSGESASADNGVMGAGGGFDVTVIPIQLTSSSDGIAIVDRKTGTICLYQYQPRRDAHERFVLLAARSFRYDVQLEEYNTASPSPAAIREMLERRGAGVVDSIQEALTIDDADAAEMGELIHRRRRLEAGAESAVSETANPVDASSAN